MGGFVFMAAWVGALELGCCGWSLYNSDALKNCKFPDPAYGLTIHNWLMVQAGFAALNLLFAPYLQLQVWRRLNEEAREQDDPNGPMSERTRQAQTANGPVRASKQDDP